MSTCRARSVPPEIPTSGKSLPYIDCFHHTRCSIGVPPCNQRASVRPTQAAVPERVAVRWARLDLPLPTRGPRRRLPAHRPHLPRLRVPPRPGLPIGAVVVAALTRTRRGVSSELPLTSASDGVPSDCVVNFDTLHTLPREVFRRPVATLDAARLEEACQALKAATGC